MRFSQLCLAASALVISRSLGSVLPYNLQERDSGVLNDAIVSISSVSTSTSTTSPASVTSGTSVVPMPPVAPVTPTTSTMTSATIAAVALASSSNIIPNTKQNSVVGSLDISSVLMGLGFKNLGINSNSPNGGCWLGAGGPNQNTIKNGANQTITVVVWGPLGSWMTDAAKPPYITIGLNPGDSTTVSCADVSGGIAALYKGTTLSQWGQIFNTWVEFTYGSWGTVNISREVRMDGNPISVVGQRCTTDMNACVFTCKSGNTCGDAGTYQINNCGPHNNGQASADGMNGGCLMGPNAALTTTFS